MTPAATLSRRFVEAFSGHPRLWQAPGRINLIGEHVDYCGGPVMPGAIDRSVTVGAAANNTGALRVHTPLGRATLPLDRFTANGDWRDYVAGMAFALAEAGHIEALQGHDLIIDSTVPVGVGVSSSAALEVAVGLALSDGGVSGAELARIAQRAENDFVGMPCGIMDQFASACGQAGHLLLLDCATLECEPVPFPEAARLVLIDSGVAHSHATGAYRDRRADCEAAAASLGVTLLAEVADPGALDSLSGNPLKRARHVLGEIRRTRQARDALIAGDLAGVGKLMNESHASLSHDMEVSTPEVDRLAGLAQSTHGVFGARMMGGGFGGSVIALVDAEAEAEVCAQLSAQWSHASGQDATVFSAAIGQGAGEIVP